MPQKSLVETSSHNISVKVLARNEVVESTTWKELAMQVEEAEELYNSLKTKKEEDQGEIIQEHLSHLDPKGNRQ